MDEQPLPPFFRGVTLVKATVGPAPGSPEGKDEKYRLRARVEVQFNVSVDQFGPVYFEYDPDGSYDDRQGNIYREPCIRATDRGNVLRLPYEGPLPVAITLHIEAYLFVKPARLAEFSKTNGSPCKFRLDVRYGRGKGWPTEWYTAEYRG